MELPWTKFIPEFMNNMVIDLSQYRLDKFGYQPHGYNIILGPILIQVTSFQPSSKFDSITPVFGFYGTQNPGFSP